MCMTAGVLINRSLKCLGFYIPEVTEILCSQEWVHGTNFKPSTRRAMALNS